MIDLLSVMPRKKKPKHKHTASKIFTDLRYAMSERADFDREWDILAEYVRGHQWQHVDGMKRDPDNFAYIMENRTQEWRPVLNHMEKTRLMRMSKYLELPIDWIIAAATNQSKDLDAAKGSGKFLQYWSESRHLEEVIKEAYDYMTTYGTSWLYYHIDNGVDVVTAISPRKVYVAPGVDNHQDADWMLLANEFTLDAALEWAEKNNVDKKKILPTSFNWMTETGTPLTGRSYGKHPTEHRDNYAGCETVLIVTRFDRDGTVTVATPNDVLQTYHDHDHYPNTIGEPTSGGIRYRFFKLAEKPLPDQLYGEAMIKAMKDPQTAINMACGFSLDIMERFAHPQTLAPKGSLDDLDELSGEPGKITEYNPVYGPPHFMQQPTPPSYLFEITRFFEEESQSVTSTPDNFGGTLPGGKDVSGRALAILDAASNAMIAVQIMGIRHTLSRLGYMILRQQKFLYDEEGGTLSFKVKGPCRAWEAESWLTADLTPGFQVTCEFGSSLERNPTLRRQEIREDFKMGLIVNPKTGRPDAERALSMMYENKTIAPYGEKDIERAKEENHRLSKAMYPQDFIEPMPYEDHQIHVEYHEEDLKTPESYRLRESNPLAYRMKVAHYMKHKQILEQEEMKRLMQSHQQIAGGAKRSTSPGSPDSSPRPGGVVPRNPIQGVDMRAIGQARPAFGNTEGA